MAHDVFISYSTKDKAIADAICANLEISGVRCWIAPRDISPGLDFPTAISNAISTSRIMVLVLSAHSNSSVEVGRELILAANRNLIIIPFKIDNIIPEPGKDYYLARTHWLDAMNPPTQDQINQLVAYVWSFLSVQPLGEYTRPIPDHRTPAVDWARPPAAPAQPGKPTRKKFWLWAVPLVLIIMAVSIYGISSMRPAAQPPLASATPALKPSAVSAQVSVTPAVTASRVSASPTTRPTLLPSLTPGLPTAATPAEIEALIAEFSTLFTQTTSNSAYSYTLEIKPDKNVNSVSVKLESFLDKKPNGTQTFWLPGDYYYCKISKSAADYLVELHAKEYWNLGPYPESVAQTLCDQFTRLNNLLSIRSSGKPVPTFRPTVILSTSGTPPAASGQSEVGILCTEISALITQTSSNSAYEYSMELIPGGNQVSVKLDSFLNRKPNDTQSFTLPGAHTCKVSKGAADYLVELHAKENWNLGLYKETIAQAICDKFTRLNTILKK